MSTQLLANFYRRHYTHIHALAVDWSQASLVRRLLGYGKEIVS